MSVSDSVPMMPKSSAMYLPWLRGVDGDEDVARVHVGVEVAVAEHLREEDLDARRATGASGRCRRAAARRRARSGCPSSAPSPALRCVVKSQCTTGTSSSGEWRKLRRSCEQLAASRVRSSSSRMRLLEFARRPRAGAAGARRPRRARPAPAAVCISARSFAMTSSMPGRSTLTATGVPSGSCAKCTCATDALAIGVRSNVANTSSTGFP